MIGLNAKILFLPNQLHYFGLEKCYNETGEEISKIISDKAIRISNSGGKQVSVCTDNFSGNITLKIKKNLFVLWD